MSLEEVKAKINELVIMAECHVADMDKSDKYMYRIMCNNIFRMEDNNNDNK